MRCHIGSAGSFEQVILFPTRRHERGFVPHLFCERGKPILQGHGLFETVSRLHSAAPIACIYLISGLRVLLIGEWLLRLAAQENVVRVRPAHIHDECFNIARHRAMLKGKLGEYRPLFKIGCELGN